MKPTASRFGLLWIGVSGAGTLAGAGIAMTFFPGAAFAVNPIGQLGWHLVGFSLSVGIGIAISQWSLLRYVLKYLDVANPSLLILWLPVTGIATASMIMPLWWLDAHAILFAPVTMITPMFPGMFLLGLGQWLVLHRLIGVSAMWIPMTVVGAAVGAILGFAVAIGGVFLSIPLEVTWAGVTGASIGLAQVPVLVAGWNSHQT